MENPIDTYKKKLISDCKNSLGEDFNKVENLTSEFFISLAQTAARKNTSQANIPLTMRLGTSVNQSFLDGINRKKNTFERECYKIGIDKNVTGFLIGQTFKKVSDYLRSQNISIDIFPKENGLL